MWNLKIFTVMKINQISIIISFKLKNDSVRDKIVCNSARNYFRFSELARTATVKRNIFPWKLQTVSVIGKLFKAEYVFSTVKGKKVFRWTCVLVWNRLFAMRTSNVFSNASFFKICCVHPTKGRYKMYVMYCGDEDDQKEKNLSF